MLDLHPPIEVNMAVLFEQDSDLPVEPGQLRHLLDFRIWVSEDSGTRRCGLSEDVTLNIGHRIRVRM